MPVDAETLRIASLPFSRLMQAADDVRRDMVAFGDQTLEWSVATAIAAVPTAAGFMTLCVLLTAPDMMAAAPMIGLVATATILGAVVAWQCFRQYRRASGAHAAAHKLLVAHRDELTRRGHKWAADQEATWTTN